MCTRSLLIVLLVARPVLLLHNDFVKNFSDFFNFGHKKTYEKTDQGRFENNIHKSKVDILGAVFKQNIAIIKHDQQMDIIFLIDASSSVGVYNFKSELKFVKKILSDVTVDYNHTRVALITFSSQNLVITNINEISTPNVENNKCLLLNRQLNNITYTGGGTFTLGALKAAKEIFETSRAEAQKILFLITDGYSNGGDPVPIARELKENQVVIFTIGISNGNYRELFEIASEPGELYSYLLDSFDEFESLARRALHVDLQSGNYYPLGISAPCNSLCPEGNCCDKKAYCTCGTLTGHYSCLCQLGYYGSGLNGSCEPCPSGSYAQGPNLCLPCPDINHVTITPAVGLKSCHCKRGYRNNANMNCELISCANLGPPENGYLVNKKQCSTVLNSACGVRCDVGYSLSGSSIRLCEEDGSWSGQTSTCLVKTCRSLPTPVHGSKICKQLELSGNFSREKGQWPVDTFCQFKCSSGYTLIGSHSRTCLPLAQWDGLKTSCKQIKCSKLSKLNFGSVEPKSCTIGKQTYGKQCNYSCLPGFELIGESSKTCIDGVWNSTQEVTCKDVTKPNLTCPDNIQVETLRGKAYGIASWDPPIINDNSGLNSTVWTKPVITDEMRFKIGSTQVSYYAEDASKNKAKCSFNVTVLDVEPPTIEACVSPPIFISNDPVNINWDEPIIYDNSQHAHVAKSVIEIFPIGTTHVTYTAIDNSNNTNTCVMNITVQRPECPPLFEPLHSTRKCQNSTELMECAITCNDGYALPLPDLDDIFDNITKFYCQHNEAEWKNAANLTGPECTLTELPIELVQTGNVEVDPVDRDICQNETHMQLLEEQVRKSLNENTLHVCNETECSIETQSNCEDNDLSPQLVKRDVAEYPSKKAKKQRKLNMNFSIRVRTKNQTRILNSRILNEEKIADDKFKFNTKFINSVCRIGTIKRRGKCVPCPTGTFHNSSSNSCQGCDFGSYNERTGQSTCKLCPINYSTRRLHAKSSKDCFEKCEPGTFAHKKLIKYPKQKAKKRLIERITLKPYCSACLIGTYQPQYGQTSCISCPANMTTSKRGALSQQDCEDTPDPCRQNPCIHGTCTYQKDLGYECQCSANYIGDNCDVLRNPCNSHPCQNDGICVFNITREAFSCTCPEGYSGPTCGEVTSYCNLSCENNSTCAFANDGEDKQEDEAICVCTPGFSGTLCEETIEHCYPNICENNGTCLNLLDDFHCHCTPGYFGRRCHLLPCDFRPCVGENSYCINEISVETTKNNYRCECLDGFTGNQCNERINYCKKNPCLNNGTCTNVLKSYSCECNQGFQGLHCEMELEYDYLLNFPRSGVTDFVEIEGFRRNLTQLSVCFWMMSHDNFNYGTILSYANHRFYNAFTITDYSGIVIYINNEYRVTDVMLNDGKWHHFCSTWEQSEGSYQIFLDSQLVASGKGLAQGQLLEGGGKLILGQEQDALGGKFSQSESFQGKLAFLDIFAKNVSYSVVQYIMNNCTGTVQGDVHSWSEFAEHIRGDVIKEKSNFCTSCTLPTIPNHGHVTIEKNMARYECDTGYEISNYKEGRKCLKAMRWEGEDPVCLLINCGNPGSIPNGYILGSKFTTGSTIEYKCNRGYTLNGSTVRSCLKDGSWNSDVPVCEEVNCAKSKLHLPRKARILIHTVAVDEDDEIDINIVTHFKVGTQLEVVCESPLLDEENNIATCLPTGDWDTETPRCNATIKLECNIDHLPQTPENAIRHEDSYEAVLAGLNFTVYYTCRRGYRQNGGNSTTCIVDGYWSTLSMQCTQITCKVPNNFTEYGFVLLEGAAQSYPLGHIIRYGCAKGYFIRGQTVARCIYPGVWSKLNAICIRQSCGKPVLRSDTEIVSKHPTYISNSELVISCQNVTTKIKCENGRWRGMRPTC